jgi:hypothetical protein
MVVVVSCWTTEVQAGEVREGVGFGAWRDRSFNAGQGRKSRGNGKLYELLASTLQNMSEIRHLV